MSRRADWPYPRFFAHRGGGAQAPENTLAAMKEGHAAGYAAVEFDVQLSRDGIAVLMHDDTLERTSTGTGLLVEQSFDDLARLDAGSWFGGAFQGEPIARFDAVANYLQSVGMAANVEIKPPEGHELAQGAVIARLCAALWGQAVPAPLVSSFSAEALRAAWRAAPTLTFAVLAEKPDAAHLALVDELGAVSLNCHRDNIDVGTVAQLHEQGVRVLCYTVNEPEHARELFAIGVDGVFTDRLDEMALAFPGDFPGRKA